MMNLSYIRWYDASGKLLQSTDAVASRQIGSKFGFQTLSDRDRQATPMLRQLTLPV